MNEPCQCNSRKSSQWHAKCTCFSCGASIFPCFSCYSCFRQTSECGPFDGDGRPGCYGVYQHKQKMSHDLWGQIHTDVSARLTAIQDGKTIASGGCGHGAGNTCTSNHRLGGYQRYIVENERREAAEAERVERNRKVREANDSFEFFFFSVGVAMCAAIALIIKFCC